MSFQANAFQNDAFQVIGSPAPDVGAQYRLLAPHYINNQYFDAGTTITVGVDVPTGWPPSADVDPLNDAAVEQFLIAGPRLAGLIRQQWSLVAVSPPITYWKEISPNLWQLQGLGLGFNPVYANISRVE